MNYLALLLCCLIICKSVVSSDFNISDSIYDFDTNSSNSRAVYQRDTRSKLLRCKFYDKEAETYHAEFQRHVLFNPTRDELKISMLFDGYPFYSKTYDTAEIFDGRTEFAECFPPDYIGRVEGCNKCNSVCFRLYGMTKRMSDASDVSFFARVEQAKCDYKYFDSIDKCFDNRDSIKYCGTGRIKLTSSRSKKPVVGGPGSRITD